MTDSNPFNILNTDAIPEEVKGTHADTTERIKEIIASGDLVLFMKGNAQAPQCGFSANSIAVLNHHGKSYKTFNILEDMDVREGVKAYSNWPTYPQLYFKGKLIGGNDIIMEMHESGDLKEILDTL
jgi:monothiol glutaredoxin